MSKKKIHYISLCIVHCALCIIFSSCGSHKNTVGTSTGDASLIVSPTYIINKVCETTVDTKNITADMTFTLEANGNDISAPGSLKMRRDEMIRLQVFIPLLGSEVGRIEFTPTQVTVIDRMHKQYLQAPYSDVDFLAENGLSFYSLQSLFWNQLFVPGEKEASTKSLKKFDIKTDAQNAVLSNNHGKLAYEWTTTIADALIRKADISYTGGTSDTSLTWTYDKFKTVGEKKFPSMQSFTFATNLGGKHHTATVTMKMNNVGTDSKWNTSTDISKKYKKVDGSDIFNFFLSK